MLIFFIVLITQFFSVTVWAWGGRGHAAICETAVHLVKSPNLKEFLLLKPHVMGHLCNTPDIYWKSLSSDVRKSGDPGHYINAEKIGLKLSEMPLDFKKLIETYTGKPNKQNEALTLYSIPDELGSSWWRADQFYRRAVAAGQNLKNLPEPKGYKEEQDNEFTFNKAFYEMIVNLGLMGHFVGDNSQPFHNTSDHDGYAANQGGIHSYYEDAVVAQFGPDLHAQIVKKAKSWKSQPFTLKKTVVENMQALSVISASEVKEVLKADPIIKNSLVKIEKGMSLKTPAERKSAAEGFKRMNKIIIKQMARSSLLLAHFWDEAFAEIGNPKVSSYKSYLYPYSVDFVKPDYYAEPQKEVQKETQK